MKIQNNINLSKKTTLKIWWISKFFVEIKTKEELFEVFRFSKKKNFKIIPLWLWSNTFFSQDINTEIIVKLKNNLIEEIKDFSKKNENIFFKIESWAILWNIINILAKKNYDLSPLNWFPSSIWWAIVWNAGLLWKEIRDYLISAEIFNLKTWEFEIWKNEDFWFEYRFSKLKWNNDYLIWSWIFDVPKWENILEKIKELSILRAKKQPQWRNAGSFFKNPKWDFAGRLIEEVWLKWYKIWWAFFSEKHSNFLTTESWVKKEDVIKLKNLAKEKVEKKFGIKLEEEVLIY